MCYVRVYVVYVCTIYEVTLFIYACMYAMCVCGVRMDVACVCSVCLYALMYVLDVRVCSRMYVCILCYVVLSMLWYGFLRCEYVMCAFI